VTCSQLRSQGALRQKKRFFIADGQIYRKSGSEQLTGAGGEVWSVVVYPTSALTRFATLVALAVCVFARWPAALLASAGSACAIERSWCGCSRAAEHPQVLLRPGIVNSAALRFHVEYRGHTAKPLVGMVWWAMSSK
jgi:hypothetical protein